MTHMNRLWEKEEPEVRFKYEISPIVVRYSQKRQRWISFFVELCGIVGGVYTVSSIVDSLIRATKR